MTEKTLPALDVTEEEALQIIDLLNNNFEVLQVYLKDHNEKLGSIANSLKEIVKHLPNEDEA